MNSKSYAARAAALGLLGLVTIPSAHAASTATQNATVSATVSSAATLTLPVTTVTFPSANPSTTPSIAATENAVSITANARTTAAGSVTLTVLAGTDLTSGGNTIPISNVTWTSASTGYNTTGTLSKTTGQAVGTWTGSGVYAGTLSFFLANSWAYVPGTYTATITYTLTAP